MAPGVAALRSAVDGVVALPVGELCASELQALIVGVARQRDRLDGLLSTAEGQLAAATGGRVGTEHGDRSVTGWLAEATRTSCGAASAALRVAGRLRELPLIVQAVLDGVLTQEQAAVLARLVGPIPTGQLQQCQPQLIEVAAGRDPVQLARYVAHLIATHSEPALEADEANAHAARYLQMRRGPDGSVRGRFRLAGGDGEALLTAIEALARRHGEPDTRSAGQRRADALVELAELSLRHADLPEYGGQRPQLSYVLPADWAARQQQRADCPICSRCPTHRPPALADTVTRIAARPTRHPGRMGRRQRRLDRPGHPSPDRNRPVRRPDQPDPARPRRAGPRAANPDRHRHRRATPRAGRPGQPVRRPRLHPTPRPVRHPPPDRPRRPRTHHPGQPGPALPPPPRPVAPRPAQPARPTPPLAPPRPKHHPSRAAPAMTRTRR